MNVIELRELKERQLDAKGRKEKLRESLESWIIDNGHLMMIDDYKFEEPLQSELIF